MASSQTFLSAYKLIGAPSGTQITISTSAGSNVLVTDTSKSPESDSDTNVLGNIANDVVTAVISSTNNTSFQYFGTATVGGFTGIILYDPNGQKGYYFLSGASSAAFSANTTGSFAGAAIANGTPTNTWTLASSATPIETFSSVSLSADSGASGSDFITNVASQTITGTLNTGLAAGEVVQVSLDNGNTWHNASTQPSIGAATFSDNVTLSGTDTLQIRVWSSAGNAGTAYSHSYTLDTAPPTATAAVTGLGSDTGTSGSDFITNAASQTVNGTYTGTLTAGEKIQVSADGTTWVDATVNATNHTWSATGVTLSGAGSTLSVRTVDTAGNTLAGTGHSYILDTTPPTQSVASASLSADHGSSSSDFITNTGTQTITGSLAGPLAAGDVVRVSTDNGVTWHNASTQPTGSGTSFSDTLTLSGSGTLKVAVFDTAGNISTGTAFSHSYTIDTTAPNVPAGIAVTQVDNDGTVHFEVTGLEDGSVATVVFKQAGHSDVPVTLNAASGGIATGTAPLTGWTDAGLTAHVTVTDTAGNTSAPADFDPAGDPVCFYPGTLVRTPDGEVAVETLRIGDLVLTVEGKAMPIRWMGRQTVSTIFADPLRVLPIRITAGALGENLPVRDLLVSPDHALLVDGVLVHAGALVNGSTIHRESQVPQVFTYHHVELADHSLILAEGVPAETFVDNVDRLAFDNWAEHEALYGDAAAIPEMELPRAKAHRQVPMAIRQRLSARAAALFGEAAAAA